VEADPDCGDEADGRERRDRGCDRNEQQERNCRDRPTDAQRLREAPAEPDETEQVERTAAAESESLLHQSDPVLTGV
jgi:hypothetical protein